MYLKNNTIINTKKEILKTSYLSKEGHVASSFSVLNILNVLVILLLKKLLLKERKV
jgi:transketolase N-terminal domain/subunit